MNACGDREFEIVSDREADFRYPFELSTFALFGDST
jgi:hypothetical protein